MRQVPLRIQVSQAPVTDKPLMRRLVDAYGAEMAAYGEGDPGRYFDAYWQEPGRWPYVIRCDGVAVGFVWVNTWSPSGRGTDFAVAEFYVAPEFRRSGVGRDAATATFRAHPGQWELAVLPANVTALAFWTAAIAAAGSHDLERVDVDDRPIFRFRVA